LCYEWKAAIIIGTGEDKYGSVLRIQKIIATVKFCGTEVFNKREELVL
jgi:hypothetical protein